MPPLSTTAWMSNRPPYVESFIGGSLEQSSVRISTPDGNVCIPRPIITGGNIPTWIGDQKTNVSIGGSIKFVINWIKRRMPRIMEVLRK